MADKIGSVAIGVTADIEPLRKQFQKASKEVQGFGDISKKTAKVVASFSAAAIAGGGALAALANSAAQTNREIQALSRLANISESSFSRMAFAARQFGVEQDKLADILKDTQDKVGDFVATGAGPMADFFDNIAPKVGLTADNFRKLSGPDALQAYVTALEKAKLPQSEMTFYMEAIASDSTLLLPLLKDQGRELNRLSDSYSEVNKTLQLTASQREGLNQLSESFDLMSTTAGNSASLIGATLAPIMSDFFSGVTSLVPKATQAIVDFFNTFQDAKNITSTASLKKEIQEITEKISGAEKLRDEGRITRLDVYNAKMDEEKERLAALQQQLKALTEQEKKLSDARTFGSSGISTASAGFNRGNDDEEGGSNTGEIDLGIFGPNDPFLDPEIILARQEEMLELDRQFWTNKGEIAGHGLDSLTALFEQNYGKTAGVVANSFATILSATATYSKKAFEANKKLALGEAIVKGYQAAVAAWAAGMQAGGPYGPIVAAAYTAASLAKTGAQIKAIRSQKFGGGGSGGAGGGTGGASGALPGASAPQAPANTVTTINLQGDTFSRDTVGALIGSINDALEDGYTLRLAT